MEKSILFTKSFDLGVAALKHAESARKKAAGLPLEWWVASIFEIGANLYLAQESYSRNNLSIKLYSARKACNKSIFATMLLRDSELFSEEDSERFVNELTEIMKMLQSSISTILEKRRRKKQPKESDREVE